MNMVSILNNWSVKSCENMEENIPILEEGGRGCRSKRKQLDPTCCPVCSITLRESELVSHLDTELDRFSKLSVKFKKQPKLQALNNSPTTGNSQSVFLGKGWETYQKVKANRQIRQKSKHKKRKTDEVTCPVCNKTTSEDITLHVEMCLQNAEKGNDSENEDENIDVEGFEEYEWAGQTRIRASSLLEGGYANTGNLIVSYLLLF